mmetsp:Transcript_19436/g.29508  ORF Transcript_19436/g.29508 Transcript_19436/m.29508 type:complete len:228 (+) Transcript_19436:786-1469(+)
MRHAASARKAIFPSLDLVVGASLGDPLLQGDVERLQVHLLVVLLVVIAKLGYRYWHSLPFLPVLAKVPTSSSSLLLVQPGPPPKLPPPRRPLLGVLLVLHRRPIDILVTPAPPRHRYPLPVTSHQDTLGGRALVGVNGVEDTVVDALAAVGVEGGDGLVVTEGVVLEVLPIVVLVGGGAATSSSAPPAAASPRASAASSTSTSTSSAAIIAVAKVHRRVMSSIATIT